MDLLRREQLPNWLARRFGSVNKLADALNVTRQTAHNLLTGRTVPSYETCQRLGLEVVFLEKPEIERTMPAMESLNDFLNRRALGAESAQIEAARQQLLKSVGVQEFAGFVAQLEKLVSEVGSVDGSRFEWGKMADLYVKFGDVSVSLTQHYSIPKFKAIFGRIPGAVYVTDEAPAQHVWDVELDTTTAGQFVWNVVGEVGEVIGLTSRALAEQVLRHLIEYKDEYAEFYRTYLM